MNILRTENRVKRYFLIKTIMKAIFFAIAIAISVGLLIFLTSVGDDAPSRIATSQLDTEVEISGQPGDVTQASPYIDSSNEDFEKTTPVRVEIKELSKEKLPYKYQVDFTDGNSNVITAMFIAGNVKQDFKVYENIIPDKNFNKKYQTVTNNFLKFDYPSAEEGRNLFTIKPNGTVKYIHLFNLDDKGFERIPVIPNDNGLVEIQPDARTNSITFALTY